MQSGTIKWFNFTKGYGFIQPNDKSRDVFLHISVVERSGIQNLDDGQKIGFTTKTHNGKVSAIDIRLIND